MPSERAVWNVVVIGAWNTAILTPDGIRRRMFELPDGTPVELEVAVDKPGSFRVAHEGILVIPSGKSLEVLPREPTPELLARAAVICSRAIRGLPETPVFAVGVNIRYRLSEVPDALLELVQAPIDTSLTDGGFEVVTASTKRTLRLPPGVVNVTVTRTATQGTLEFNFHRDSTVAADLLEWIDRVGEFVQLADRLAPVVGVPDARAEVHG